MQKDTEWVQTYIASRIRLGGLLPNDGYIMGVPKIIHHDQSNSKLTNGGNVGAGLDTIFVFSVVASSLRNDGDILDIWAAGDLADNANTKRIAVSWGPAIIEDTGNRDIRGLGWLFNARISRVSSTVTIVNHTISAGVVSTDSAQVVVPFNVGGYFNMRTNPVINMDNLNSNNTGFLITAEGTANDDIVINQIIISLTRFQ